MAKKKEIIEEISSHEMIIQDEIETVLSIYFSNFLLYFNRSFIFR